MFNVKAEVKGNVLTLTVDLSKRGGPSKSGKTTLVASTNGTQTLPDGSKYGLNVFTSN